MGIKKSIKQKNSKQKRHIAPKSKEFRSWILRKVTDNGIPDHSVRKRPIVQFDTMWTWSFASLPADVLWGSFVTHSFLPTDVC